MLALIGSEAGEDDMTLLVSGACHRGRPSRRQDVQELKPT
jgi:hypothetical protein